MTRPQLHGTPLSHFTRKIRILLAELGVEYDFVRLPGVLVAGAAAYGDNPLLRIPTLVVAGETVFDSDHIARYVVAQYDPADWFGVRSDRAPDLNRLAATNGIMANGVTLILAKRGGGVDLDAPYFRKLTTATETALAWLDAHPFLDSGGFDYRDITLVSMWQHLEHYKIIPALDRYPRIASRVRQFVARPSIATTAPEQSLADARSAGWAPG